MLRNHMFCSVIQPVDGVMDVIETLHSGASTIVCVVDHIECATYYEGSFSIMASALCIPGVLYCQSS